MPSTPLGVTPPASENGFAFANGEFFAEGSGHHLHRRANLAELKEHFASGSDKDHPAHWFEAQLIHHGLPPSKTKAVARMRLFDAVNTGKLKVPADVSKLEGKLKKEWTKNDRDAKKAHKDGGEVKNKTVTTPKTTTKTTKTTKKTTKTTTTTTTLKATGTKRKASDNASATTTSTPLGRPATKKTKTTPSKDSRAPKLSSTQETPAPRTKQTARCSRGSRSQGLGRGASTALPPPAPSSRPRQTARRSGSLAARGRITAPPAPPRVEGGYSSYGSNSYYDDENDEPPPPYSEVDQGSDSHGHEGDSCSQEGDSHGYDSDSCGQVGDSYGEDSDSYGEDGELRPLGLLNGRYDMTSSEVSSQWPSCGSEFDFVFTISGSSMWASFDLGIVEGVMYFAQRPMKSSHDRVPFTWRGEERDGPIVYGDENEGWIKFLGDGRIEGKLEWMGLDFRGRRLPGQGTRSEIEAYTLRSRWEGYSEEEYERLSRARWN